MIVRSAYMIRCAVKKGSFGEDSLFLPFTSGKRCTAGTRDNEFSTSREWAAANYLMHVTRGGLDS